MLGLPSGMSYPAPLPAPLYQGSVNTWECDDGGHLNVRFHFERAFVGLAHMAGCVKRSPRMRSFTWASMTLRSAWICATTTAHPARASPSKLRT